MEINTKKDKIKACIAFSFIIIIIVMAIILTIKYQEEGEIDMPFKLSKITVVSTAEGTQNDGATEKWNLSIIQNNDVYFSVEKYKDEESDIIESVSIENIQITKLPELGKIKTYMPNSSDGRLFTYSDDNVIENSLIYKGASKTNNKMLEIGNKGGTAVIRFSNTEIGNYVSDEDQEVKHDGTMLSKTDATTDNIKFTVNFDFIIKLKDNSYKSNISIDLPCGDDLMSNGTCSKEIKDKFVFKRV